MKLSTAGIAAINAREGERLVVYRDSDGKPTVCKGHLVTPSDHLRVGDAVPAELCTQFSAHDLGAAEDAVNHLVTVPLNQNQFDALVSLVYNIGAAAFATSTLLKLLNAGNYLGAQAEFARWHYAGGKPDQGLLNRRMAEAAQFGKPAPVALTSTTVQVADIPQTIAPVPVAAGPVSPPPSRVTQTRSGKALVGSAVTGAAGAVTGGIAIAKPALNAIAEFHTLTAGLPAWLLLVATPLVIASIAFSFYGIWHKARTLQGAAP